MKATAELIVDAAIDHRLQRMRDHLPCTLAIGMLCAPAVDQLHQRRQYHRAGKFGCRTKAAEFFIERLIAAVKKIAQHACFCDACVMRCCLRLLLQLSEQACAIVAHFCFILAPESCDLP